MLMALTSGGRPEVRGYPVTAPCVLEPHLSGVTIVVLTHL